MKKILALIFALLFTLACAGCSKPIIYEEEKETTQWLSEKTQGYSLVPTSAMMILTDQENGWKIQINTGSDMVPQLLIKNASNRSEITERSVLTVTTTSSLFAKATHASRVFNPYPNRFNPALQVWQKDATTFRIFFWLYGANTDFYPIPRLLTEKQYQTILGKVTDYNKEQEEKADLSGDRIINYTADFLKLYENTYYSEIAPNPDGDLFYQYTGEASDYMSIYRALFLEMGLSEQDWRKSFQSLGYTEQQTLLHVVYCDLTVEDGKVHMVLNTEDTYSTPSLKEMNLPLKYAFCPTVNDEGIQIEVK